LCDSYVTIYFNYISIYIYICGPENICVYIYETDICIYDNIYTNMTSYDEKEVMYIVIYIYSIYYIYINIYREKINVK